MPNTKTNFLDIARAKSAMPKYGDIKTRKLFSQERLTPIIEEGYFPPSIADIEVVPNNPYGRINSNYETDILFNPEDNLYNNILASNASPEILPAPGMSTNELPIRFNPITTGGGDPRYGNRNFKGMDKYFATLKQRESSNDYTVVNKQGFVGGYQMGLPALIDAGLVKPGTKGGNKALDNSKNWVGSMSKSKFLANPAVQDRAVRAYTNRQIGYLGDTYRNAKSDKERFGMLGASHLIGAGGYRANPASVDANGVSGNDYYDLFYNQEY